MIYFRILSGFKLITYIKSLVQHLIFRILNFYISHNSKLKLYEEIWKKFEDVVMLRDSSKIPKRTHHNKHQINDTLGSLKGLTHSILLHLKETIKA